MHAHTHTCTEHSRQTNEHSHTHRVGGLIPHWTTKPHSPQKFPDTYSWSFLVLTWLVTPKGEGQLFWYLVTVFTVASCFCPQILCVWDWSVKQWLQKIGYMDIWAIKSKKGSTFRRWMNKVILRAMCFWLQSYFASSFTSLLSLPLSLSDFYSQTNNIPAKK